MIKPAKFLLTTPGLIGTTALLLMVPAIAMQLTDEVNWSVSDFIIAGALILVTGACFQWVLKTRSASIYKLANVLTIGTTFFLIWANLAVGLIGEGANLGNLMYIGVLAISIMFTIRSRMKAEGMEQAAFITAGAVAFVALIALVFNMDQYPGSSVTEILGVNGFFTALYLLCAFLYRHAKKQTGSERVAT